MEIRQRGCGLSCKSCSVGWYDLRTRIAGNVERQERHQGTVDLRQETLGHLTRSIIQLNDVSSPLIVALLNLSVRRNNQSP